MIIEIEGCDGVGKTTVARLLAEKIGAEYFKFPDRSTPTGKVIADMLTGKTMLEATTFQALNIVNRLEKAAELDQCYASKFNHCVCDRYVQSAVVYGSQDGLDPAWLATVAGTQAIPEADLHVLLWMDPTALDAERLAGRDREIYESRGVKGLVAQELRFLQIWQAHESDPRWVKYSTDERSANTIAEMVHSDLDYIIKAAQ
jgi:thymidylate kinase